MLQHPFINKNSVFVHFLSHDFLLSSHQNFTYISIQVLDVNDNVPQFTKVHYAASIPVATAKEGAFVLSVSATDLDIGNNSVISYR